MARCSAVWPSSPSAFITFASVSHSSVFISSLKSASIGVGCTPSNRTRTLSFFFTQLLRPFEFAGEQIIHHQRREVGRHPKILLRIVVLHAQSKLVAPVYQASKQFVHPKLF